MKKILPFITCLAFQFVSAQNTFIGSVGTNIFERFDDVTEASDGNYLATGITEAVDTFYGDFYIAKINTAGQLMWAYDIGSDSTNEPSEEGNGITNTSDNGFAVAGALQNAPGLLRFNSSGTLQWAKQYQEYGGFGDIYPQGGIGFKTVQTSDGGFMFCGNIPTTDQGKGVIIRTDDTGKVVWAKSYFNYENPDITIEDLKKTNDNNYVFVSDNPGLSGGTDSTYIVKIDPSGNVLWSDYIFSPVANTDGKVVLSTSDNGFLVTGTSTSTSVNFTPDCFMFKVDNNGNLLWSKETNNTANSGATINGALETSDGSYIVGGDGFNLVSDSAYYYLLQCDKDGNLTSTKTIEKQGGTDYSSIFSIIKTSDNNYVAAGTYFDGYDYEDYDGMVMKLDNSLNACQAEGTAGELKDYGTFAAGAVAVITDETSLIVTADIGVTTTAVGDLISVCSTLPLTLLSFDGSIQNNAVQLQWQTTNEINTSYFEVERSRDGISFDSIATIRANDNNAITGRYGAVDNDPFIGANYYRLKMADIDGAYTYSKVVQVNFTGTIPEVRLSPNPANDILTFRITDKSSSQAQIELLDMNGRMLAQKSRVLNEGANDIQFNVSGFAAGIYFAKIIRQGNVQNMKWMKVQ